MLLQSPLLSSLPGLHHGFSTRLGGVSARPAATWDFGPQGHSEGQENRRRLALALGFEAETRIVEVEQVHGVDIVSSPVASGAQADGIVETDPGSLVGVRTADCTPVLFAALDANHNPIAVAAVHAGWRGATAGILAAAVQALSKYAPVVQIMAAIGPCISAAHFEVGDEVIDAAKTALRGQAPATRSGPRGRPHLDLVDLCRRLLLQEGLPRDHIDIVYGCTYDNAALFFSYRRDAGQTGRHLSAIGFREVT